MEFIFKKIKEIASPQRIEELSMRLMVDDETFVKLTDSIVAGLFGTLLTRGDNLETESMLKTFVSQVEDDRKTGIYFLDDNIDSKRIEAAITLGDTLFFEKRRELISFLSELTVVDEERVENLMNALTYTFGLGLGRRLTTGGYTITGLLGQIHAERNFFLARIPLGVMSILGLPSLLTIGKSISSDAKVVSDMVYYKIMHDTPPVKEQRGSWKKWISSRAAAF